MGKHRVFGELLDKQMNVLLTSSQYKLVKENAWAAKMTLGEYVRRKLGFFGDKE